MFAGGGDGVAAQQLHDAGRCGRTETGQADAHAADVDGVEAVDVLVGQDGLGDLLLVNVGGQGELDYEAVDLGVAVEAVDFADELGLGDGVGEAEQRGAEAAALAGADLVGHVCLGASVVAHQDGA